jgi:hypothetical protein
MSALYGIIDKQAYMDSNIQLLHIEVVCIVHVLICKATGNSYIHTNSQAIQVGGQFLQKQLEVGARCN